MENEMEKYNKMIFIGKEDEAEWELLNPLIKNQILKNLELSCQSLENEQSIQLLCRVINDLMLRMEKLEENKLWK